MPGPHETVMFDVHDCKVYKLLTDTGASPTYDAAVDVPGIAEVGLDPTMITAELKGDARVMAKKGRVDRITISATYGKLDVDVLDVIMEGDLTDNGSVSTTFLVSGDNSLPYFKFAFLIDDLDIGVGSVHVTLFKAQLTGGTLVGGSTDSFNQPTMQIEGIATDSDDKMLDVTLYTSQTALPA